MKLTLTLAMLLACGSAFAQSIGGTSFIAVQGKATVRIIPDVFPLSVEITDKSNDAAQVQASVEALAAQVLASARAQGLKDADIAVGNLVIRPQMDYDEKTRQETFQGNSYSRGMELRFHKLSDLKAFIAKLPSSKLLQVQTREFQVSSIIQAQDALMIDAMRRAREKGDQIAAALGKRIVRVQTVSDQPLGLGVGSYINSMDVASIESTTILTAEQVARIPVPRDITTVGLLSGRGSRGGQATEIALSEGLVTASKTAYMIFLLGD